MAKHALLVVIDEYPPGLKLASLTPSAALAPLRDALVSDGVGGFAGVSLLYNPERAALTDALMKLFSGRRRSDLLLLCVAAAGAIDTAGRAHLLMPGYRGQLHPRHTLPVASLMNSAQMSQSSRCVLFLDVGFSLAAGGQPNANGVLAQEPMKLANTAVLASAAGSPFSAADETAPQRRLLLPWLTRQLSGEVPNLPRGATLSDIYQHLRQATPSAELADVPRLWLGHLRRGALALARNPAASPPAARDPAQLQAPGRSPFAPRRRSGVRKHSRETAIGGRRRKRLSARKRRRRAIARSRFLLRLAGIAIIGPLALFFAGEHTSRDLRLGTARLLHQIAPSALTRAFVREQRPVFSDALRGGGRAPAVVELPGGFFKMGSYAGEAERFGTEGPARRVGVNPFAIGISEVSFDDYDRFAEATGRPLPDDRGWGRGNRPVINVSWRDAVAYTRWLSAETGSDYFLPTEAQWEYAARAGTETPFATGDCIHTDQANYNGVFDYNRCGARTGIFRGETLPATALPPNRWGLYNMQGNVWEWVGDCWGADRPDQALGPSRAGGGAHRDCRQRVIRGGGWRFEPGFLRSAARVWSEPDTRNGDIGFRVARALD